MTQARCCWRICPHRWLLVSLQESERRRMSHAKRTHWRWDVCEIYTCSDSISFAICQCLRPAAMCDRTGVGSHGEKSNQQVSNVLIVQCHLDQEKQSLLSMTAQPSIHLSIHLFSKSEPPPPTCFLELLPLPWQLIAFLVSRAITFKLVQGNITWYFCKTERGKKKTFRITSFTLSHQDTYAQSCRVVLNMTTRLVILFSLANSVARWSEGS